MIIAGGNVKKGNSLGRFDGFVFQAIVIAAIANICRVVGQAVNMNGRIRTGAGEYLASRLAFDVSA